MNKNSGRVFLFILEIIIGIIIIFAPTIITGEGYNPEKTMGSLLTAEFVMRTLSLIFGLYLIYLSFKSLKER